MRLFQTAAVWGLLTLFSANAVGNPADDDDLDSCVESLGGGLYLMSNPKGAETDCLFVANEPGTFIRLREGEMIVSRDTGILMHGTARIYTAGIPYSIVGNQAHLIIPDNVVDVIVEGKMTYILSKEGCTSVTGCYEDEERSKSYFLEQEDLLVLSQSGALIAWEDADGESRIDGGCAQAHSKSAKGFLWFLLLMVVSLRLRRRTRKG